jgi:hypothetical protein
VETARQLAGTSGFQHDRPFTQRLDPIEEFVFTVFVPGLQIPLDPANVLGWARPAPRHATGQLARPLPLHAYLVAPPRGEVINVDKAFVFAEMKRGQRQFIRHGAELQDALMSFAVTPATNAERVQMLVGQAHDDLDDMVQLSERQVLGTRTRRQTGGLRPRSAIRS